MFTGIITDIGKILRITSFAQQARLQIQPASPTDDYKAGESIAVNGVCLTVESFTTNSFMAYASQETLAITNLKYLTPNSTVNLERALKVGDHLGGHFVSGHVDTMATVKQIITKADSHDIQIGFAAEFSKFIVPKGSITLDGISLTVNNCDDHFLNVNVIPTTFTNTSIKNWHCGYRVNMETDLLGKYAVNCMQKDNHNLTTNFLQQCGFGGNNNEFL